MEKRHVKIGLTFFLRIVMKKPEFSSNPMTVSLHYYGHTICIINEKQFYTFWKHSFIAYCITVCNYITFHLLWIVAHENENQ